MFKNTRYFPLHRKCSDFKTNKILSYAARVLCGLAVLGTTAQAGSLYWDNSIDDYQNNDIATAKPLGLTEQRASKQKAVAGSSSAAVDVTPLRDEPDITLSHDEVDITLSHDETDITLSRDEADITLSHDEADITLSHDEADITLSHDEADVTLSHDEADITLSHDETDDLNIAEIANTSAVASKADDLHDTAPDPEALAKSVTYDPKAFRSDPVYSEEAYDPEAQIAIYGGKTKVATQRPIPELGRPFYDVGPLSPGIDVVGRKNLVFAHLYGFGDWRTALAFNDNGDNEVAQIATRLNLDIDLGLTATERLHALFQPLQKEGQFTRCEFGGNDGDQDCSLEFDAEPQTLFFEGDLAAIYGGLTDTYPRQDLPITGGLVPLLFQNGIWVEDAFWGGAFSIPAMNSRALDISNADVTVFAGFDEVNANGVVDASGKIAESNVNVYGIAAFIETLEGYIEAGYGYVDAEDNLSDQDYQSATVALTRRYGGKVSNSIRLVGSFGQDRDQGDDQNGLMVLVENSLITSKPYQLLPYANAFVGIERPVPLARQNGILKNTGINFESDALTGFPFLDDTGQNAYGGAIGIQYLFDFEQQIVVEVAGVRELADISSSQFEQVVENQYAIGARYQRPLSNAWIFRADAMYGWLESNADSAGVRTELRFKF